MDNTVAPNTNTVPVDSTGGMSTPVIIVLVAISLCIIGGVAYAFWPKTAPAPVAPVTPKPEAAAGGSGASSNNSTTAPTTSGPAAPAPESFWDEVTLTPEATDSTPVFLAKLFLTGTI